MLLGFYCLVFLAQAQVVVKISICKDGIILNAGHLSGGEESGLAYQTQQAHFEGDTQ